MPLALRYAARSDVGLVRASNQDSAYAGPHLLVVADGMGGHAGGDVASSVVVGELALLEGESHGPDAAHQLELAIARAHDAVLRRVDAEPQLAGMGTTVTALLRTGDRLVLAHVGDSRAYLLRDGELTQVTSDHTFVQRLVDEGRITPEEAERHPQRSVLLRVLGDVDSPAEVDTSVRAAQAGDRWLLCSDGLSGVVSDETLAETLGAEREVTDCADALVQLALRGGGPDNVTVIVADVVEADTEPDLPQVVGSAAVDRRRASAASSSPAARAAALARGRPSRGGATVLEDTGTLSRAELADRLGQDERLDDEDGASHGDRARPPRLLRRLLWVAVPLVLVGGALAVAWAWVQTQYYVGVDDGQVAIFRGLSQELGPISLSWVHEPTSIRTSDLSPVYAQRVERTIAADDLADAQRTVADLRAQARRTGAG